MENNKKRNELNNRKVKILVDASFYNFENDNCSVIPFFQNLKWGAMNGKGEVIIQPKYDFVIPDPLTESGLIRVGVILDPYNKQFANTDYAPYYRHRVGLFDNSGKKVLGPHYQGILISQDGNFISVENMEGHYGVLNIEGNVVVPFGKYSYIDGFDSGYARVRIGNQTNGLFKTGKWGLINEKGEEVLPVIYDQIWKFYGKKRSSTMIEKDGTSELFYFDKTTHPNHEDNSSSYEYHDDGETHYGEFAGTYAQDVMGYSDDDIYDAFDGDPDVYWNID